MAVSAEPDRDQDAVDLILALDDLPTTFGTIRLTLGLYVDGFSLLFGLLAAAALGLQLRHHRAEVVLRSGEA